MVTKRVVLFGLVFLAMPLLSCLSKLTSPREQKTITFSTGLVVNKIQMLIGADEMIKIAPASFSITANKVNEKPFPVYGIDTS